MPEIASSVEISDDSLEYIFSIDPNQYYQNSQVFSTGIGRRVIASDIKHAFERTAKAGFPTHAAELLMGIAGYENYYLEQRSVYDAEKRVLGGVSGIQVVDRQTLGIVLEEKDPRFLEKLASPYLFIYPQEAVSNNEAGLANNPVGTGPYELSQVVDSTRVVLTKHEVSTNQQESVQSPLVNRINISYFSDEGQMLQAFTGGEIDWIPEMGPQMSDQVLGEDEELKASYNMYHLVENDADRVTAFYLNQRSTVNQDWLINRLAYLTNEDFSTRGELTLNVTDFEVTDNAQPMEQYYVAYTEDTVARRILTELHNIVFMPESSLVLFDIRVPTRQTSIYTYQSNSYQESLNPMNEHYWLRIDTQILELYSNHVRGIETSTVPWQLNIEDIRAENRTEGI